MNWLKKLWKVRRESVPRSETPAEARFTTHSTEAMNNFTPRAQQVLALSRKEADRFHHNFVGTEHLLLGLIALGQGTAVAVLRKLGLDLESVRLEVEMQVGPGPDQKLMGHIPYTPRVKKVLALASKEAQALNHTYVGTEHILLGLLREGDGVAARVLKGLEVDVEETRRAILCELDPNFTLGHAEAQSATPERTITMPSAFEKQMNPGKPDSNKASVDTSKRYDVYCRERDQEVVVYRNAAFKDAKHLFRSHPYDHHSEFVELEPADGPTMFVAKSSIIKFCEHGETSGNAALSDKET